jgi:hypothetical protein
MKFINNKFQNPLHTMDQLDETILSILESEGPMPFSEIASFDRAEVVGQTVKTRLEGLEQQRATEHLSNGVWAISLNGRHYLDGEYDLEEQQYVPQQKDREGAIDPTHCEVERTIRGLLKKWESEGHTAREINSGICGMFAEKALQQVNIDDLPENGVFPAATPVIESEIDIHTDDYPHHEWVFAKGWHYDAEVPTGVADWRDLPFFNRVEDAGHITILEKTSSRV